MAEQIAGLIRGCGMVDGEQNGSISPLLTEAASNTVTAHGPDLADSGELACVDSSRSDKGTGRQGDSLVPTCRTLVETLSEVEHDASAIESAELVPKKRARHAMEFDGRMSMYRKW